MTPSKESIAHILKYAHTRLALKNIANIALLSMNSNALPLRDSPIPALVEMSNEQLQNLLSSGFKTVNDLKDIEVENIPDILNVDIGPSFAACYKLYKVILYLQKDGEITNQMTMADLKLQALLKETYQ